MARDIWTQENYRNCGRGYTYINNKNWISWSNILQTILGKVLVYRVPCTCTEVLKLLHFIIKENWFNRSIVNCGHNISLILKIIQQNNNLIRNFEIFLNRKVTTRYLMKNGK